MKIKEIIHIGLFVALITIGAFIKVPISIIPITLQSMMVVLSGLILKKYNSVIAVMIYIFIGLIGFPVFANGGGIQYILVPSFGYILGFLLAVLFIAKFKSDNFKINIVISIIALLLIYLSGILYFVILQFVYYKKTFTLAWIFYYLFLVYIPGDIITVVLANIVYKKIKNVI